MVKDLHQRLYLNARPVTAREWIIPTPQASPDTPPFFASQDEELQEIDKLTTDLSVIVDHARNRNASTVCPNCGFGGTH